VLFNCKNGEHHALANTYYIPRLTANIVSCGQLDENDFDILIKGGVMRVHDGQGGHLAKIDRGPSRLYVLDLTIARPVCLAAHAGEDAWRWHTRFGHANFTALKKMKKEGLVRGLPALSQVEQLCEACLAGKHRRAPFPAIFSGVQLNLWSCCTVICAVQSLQPHRVGIDIFSCSLMITVGTCG
jgi:hypothetical protein